MDLLKNKYNFTIDFFSKEIIYPFYDNVYNKTNGEDFFNEKSISPTDLKNRIYVVKHISPYLDLKINTARVPYSCFKTHQLDGFLANLEGYHSIVEYMRDQFGAKSRSKIRAYLRRLETCFDVRYKMFHGNISKEEYLFLFERFLLMIKRRFAQRGEIHGDLKYWDFLKETSYALILKKKASLFVIYDEEKPIDICLNYHHQNVLNNSIRSYDIDYSKFRLGHIDILKQLEWCFENQHTIFDLSYGDLEYKRKWCNVTYEFEQHVLFPKGLISKRILAYILLQLIVLKGFLKKKKVHILLSKIKSVLKKPTERVQAILEDSFEITDVLEVPPMESMTEIDIDLEEYAFLRKIVHDFQYINFDTSNNIRVCEMNNRQGSYVIIGQKKIQKVILT